MATPVWKEIYGALRHEIAENVYRTGDKLPTEKELSQRFSVNRHTVRRALAELTTEGAIYVRRGSGAYVAEGIIEYPLGAEIRFSANIQDLGRTPSHRLVQAECIIADEKLGEKLGIRPGAPVLQIDSTADADGLPIVYAERRFPRDRFPRLVEDFEETGSISAALARYGVVDYRRAWTRVMASAPSRRVAAQLRQPDVQPVIRTETLNLDMAGQPIEYTHSYWAGSRAQFVIEGCRSRMADADTH
jgi:GntR family phosphonate transport system transcriptional regulator